MSLDIIGRPVKYLYEDQSSFTDFKQNIAGNTKQINGLLTIPTKFNTTLIFYKKIETNNADPQIPNN